MNTRYLYLIILTLINIPNYLICQEWMGLTDINECSGRAIKIHGNKLYVIKCGVKAWDGSEWDELPFYNCNSSLLTIEFLNDTLYRGGDWRNTDSTNDSNVCLWNGTEWVTVGETFDDENWSSTKKLRSIDGYLYSLGHYDQVGSMYTDNISRWNGQNWETFGPGLDYTPKEIVKYRDEIIVCGTFKASGVDSTISGMAKIINDSIVPFDTTMLFDEVSAMIVFDTLLFFSPDSDTLSNGLEVNRIVYWNGYEYRPAGNDIILRIYSFHEFGGELYASAAVKSLNPNVPRNIVMKWNGYVFWEQVGGDFDDIVTSLNDYQGELYAAGAFDFVDNTPINGLAKYSIISSNKNVESDDSILYFPNPVKSMISFTLPSDGRLSLLSIEGEKVLELDVLAGENQLNLTNISDGIYFVMINYKNKIITNKLIKNSN